MTSTLSPRDTGEILLPEDSQGSTQNLTYATQGPLFRRPDATGEIPRIVDQGDAQPIAPLSRVISADDIVWHVVATGVGAPKYVGQHRRPSVSLWSQLAAVVARMWQL